MNEFCADLDVTGRELRDLLSPIKPDVFFRDYWEKRPLHIRGARDRFNGLFDRDQFVRFVDEASHIQADFGAGRTVHRFGSADVDALIRAGATVCLAGVDRLDRRLATLVCALRAQMNFIGAIDVRSYLSGDAAGFDTHFDARIAMTLQIGGRKRWRFSKTPAMPFPTDNVVKDARGRFYFNRSASAPRKWEKYAAPKESDFSEVVLHPGDVLCLPAGTWHKASALGGSLALNISFNPAGALDLLTEALAPLLLSNPEWRRCPPPFLGAGGALPAEAARFLSSRLSELRAALDRLEPQGPELAAVLRSRVYAPAGHAQPPSHGAAAPAALRRKDLLRLSRRGPIGYGVSRGDTDLKSLALYQGVSGIKVELPIELLPLIRRLVTLKSFRADSCLAWAGRRKWIDIKPVLESLMEFGFLELVSA